MILKQVKQNGIEVIVSVAVILVAMALSMFLKTPAQHIVAPIDGTPLFNSIYSHVLGGHISVGTQLTALVFLVLEAFMLILLNSDFEFTRAKPSLFMLVYFPLALSIVPNNTFLPEQIANIFIALGLIKVFACHGLDDAKYTFFDGGLFFGLAALFCIPALIMLVVGVVAIMVFRPFKGREYIVFVLGFVTPLLFYAAIYFLVEGNVAGLLSCMVDCFAAKAFAPLPLASLIAVGVHAVVIVVASIIIIGEYPKFNLISSQAYRLMFIMFMCVVSLCLTPFFGLQTVRMSLLPLAMMFVTVFHGMRHSLWADIFFGVFALSYVAIQLLWYGLF